MAQCQVTGLSVAELVWRGLTVTGGLLGARGDLDEGLSLLLAGKVKATMELISLEDVSARNPFSASITRS
eukprot:gene40853-biopygen27572